MSSRVYKSKIVTTKETFIEDRDKNNQQEQRCKIEEEKRAKLNRKTAEEQKRIKILATRKLEKREYVQDELAIPPDSDYDRAYKEASKDLPLYSRRSNKALAKSLSIAEENKSICKQSISREEVIKYVEKNLPDYFSFGDVPKNTPDGDSCVAYHVTRIRTQQIPVYSMYSTLLVKIPSRLDKYATSRPTRESDIKYSRGLVSKEEEERYTPKYKYLYNQDAIIEQNTIKGILENYEPGMVLEPKILIGVLRNRLNCTSSLRGYSESRSYNIFEGWLAAALELKEEAPLAYLLGIFDYPSKATRIYDTCVAEDRNCEDNLIDTIGEVSDLYWDSSQGENDPKAPESLRR